MKPLTTIDSVAMLVNEIPSGVEYTFKDECMVLTANWRATGTPWLKRLTRACTSLKCKRVLLMLA